MLRNGCLLLLWLSCAIAPAASPQGGKRVEVEKYPNGTTQMERAVVEDDRGQLVPHGKYRTYYENGKRAERGLYRDGLLHGVWKEWHRNGKLRLTGKYDKGLRVGEWEAWDEDGRIDRLNTGVYRFDQSVFPDGALRFSGYLLDGAPHGEWSYYWPSGQWMAKGAYARGERTGDWAFWHSDGTYDPYFQSGHFERDVRTGDRVEPAEDRSDPPLATVASSHVVRPNAIRRLVAKLPTAGGASSSADWSALISELRERGAKSVGEAIGGLLELDIAGANGTRGRLFDSELLRGLTGGCMGWRAPVDEAALQFNRRTQRRWESLWALKFDDPFFFCIGVPLPEDPDAESPLVISFPLPRNASGEFERLFPERFDERAKELALSKRARESLARALRWLGRAQEPDGRWRSATHGGAAYHDVGVTSLALLALVADGNTHEQGPYRDEVRRAVAWLLRQVRPENGGVGESRAYTAIYSHCLATLALSESLAMTSSPALHRAVELSCDYLLSARTSNGGWRYNVPSNGEQDTSVTSWALLALFAAQRAGVSVDRTALSDGRNLFAEFTDRANGRIGYDSIGTLSARVAENIDAYPRDVGEALTASGLRVGLVYDTEFREEDLRMSARQRRARTSSERLRISQQLGLLLELVPQWDREGFGNDMYYWYHASEAMVLMGAKPRKRWFDALEKTLIQGQSSDGSWDPNGPWGGLGGRVYSTALLALALESSYRHNPGRVAAARHATKNLLPR